MNQFFNVHPMNSFVSFCVDAFETFPMVQLKCNGEAGHRLCVVQIVEKAYRIFGMTGY